MKITKILLGTLFVVFPLTVFAAHHKTTGQCFMVKKGIPEKPSKCSILIETGALGASLVHFNVDNKKIVVEQEADLSWENDNNSEPAITMYLESQMRRLNQPKAIEYRRDYKTLKKMPETASYRRRNYYLCARQKSGKLDACYYFNGY